ncbi:glycosyl hydrolase 115 family protein [Paenibacillus sp. WLX1005]|uniref:glycosyl hydrolase 115 family protein n=1 Tax=Paenibacillus sp. WLX1005 TaxID=3243766 RepID=UPI003983DFAC
MSWSIDKQVTYIEPEQITTPIRYVLRMIYRDHEAVFGEQPNIKVFDANDSVEYEQQTDVQEDQIHHIRILLMEEIANDPLLPREPEMFVHRMGAQGVLDIIGIDELGIIYGLLHYSRYVLGVDPFWFWAELAPARREQVYIAELPYVSQPFAVRYRGWFVNDEVCLIGWTDVYPPGEDVWQPVFEALLRCGGNMVIPGTDLPREGIHHRLAVDMGLWVTHHHAEPLGAEMFARAFPELTPSYEQYPQQFEQLWRQAIERQQDEKIVWVLSFRGQGDKPFWEDDPQFDTPSSRGTVISNVLRKQYEMIADVVQQPVYCIALYGELAELYRDGHLQLPDGVIKIWADNGYGKMVSRRHGNHNVRVSALPQVDDHGPHGIYYHVTFHDLQASNHLTMFPSSSALMNRELDDVLQAGADRYWLINCGNILQHLPFLDLIAAKWQTGYIDATNQQEQWIHRLYPQIDDDLHRQIAALYQQYAQSTIVYGPHEDDRAGEELYHHVGRRLIGHWMKQQHIGDRGLYWLTGHLPFPAQLKMIQSLMEKALPRWQQLQTETAQVAAQLQPVDAERLYRQFGVQVQLHESGCRGLLLLCAAYRDYRSGEHARAFVQISQALWAYEQGQQALDLAAQGRWQNFYRADWLTNIRNTLEHVDTLRRYVRIMGDGPDLFAWYKQYLMPETEKHIYLENTHRNPLADDELAHRLKEYLDAQIQQIKYK